MPTRSLWAWGDRERFPDETARAALGQMARALVPTAQPAPRTLPPDEPVVPTPAVAVPSTLADVASQSPLDRAARARGRGFLDLVAGFAGDFAGAPDIVARPRDAAEVARVLAECDVRGWAVVPFGGGTSVVGGVDAAAARGDREAVVSLDLEAIAGVRELDVDSRLARVGAGTLGPRVEAELGARGFALRHFPQSFEFSTVGGWLATRAGGHYATGPTRIDEHCAALELVSPRGAIATHRHPSSGAGPEPARLLVGSEGAFGVITEAWLRVVPKPTFRASATAAFRSFDDGVRAARALAQSGLQPSNARLLDPTEARLSRVRFDGATVLLIAFESADHPLDAWLARAVELARDHGGDVTVKEQGAEAGTDEAAGRPSRSRGGDAGSWKRAFVDAPYLQSALLSVGVLADTFETACTWSAFPELHARITADVTRALVDECGGGALACRFTHVYPDGPAPYYTFVGALRVGGEAAQWRRIKAAASDALAAAGGTITHHHAVGRTHAPWYARERPALVGDALAAMKRALDPRGIMNPGVLGLC
jgi:alkyldihydroxyacetonephosphate synthase